MTFELIWTLWHFPVERRAQCIKTQYNETSFILWGFLMSLFAFSLFLYCSLVICFAIYVYLHVWICMCCRIHVLYTTWFVISPTQLRWTKPSPPNNRYNTLWGPGSLIPLEPVYYPKKKKRTHTCITGYWKIGGLHSNNQIFLVWKLGSTQTYIGLQRHVFVVQYILALIFFFSL